MATQSTGFIEVLSPAADRGLREVSLAARHGDLNGKRLGLLDNGKFNAGALVTAIGDLLGAEFKLASVVKRSKSERGLAAGGPMSEEMLADLVSGCDVVVNAVGD